MDLSDEETRLIEETRRFGLAPAEVIDRAARDLTREQEQAVGGRAEDPRTAAGSGGQQRGSEELATLGEVDKRVEQRAAKMAHEITGRLAVANFRTRIDELIDDALDAADPAVAHLNQRRRQALKTEIAAKLQEGEGKVADMSPAQFRQAAGKAAKAVIAAERDFAGKLGAQTEQEQEEAGARVAAMAAAGEAGGAARSTGSGDTEPVDREGKDMKFGLGTDWSGDPARASDETHAAAVKDLKKIGVAQAT